MKKKISLILAVIMVLSVFTTIPMTWSIPAVAAAGATTVTPWVDSGAPADAVAKVATTGQEKTAGVGTYFTTVSAAVNHLLRSGSTGGETLLLLKDISGGSITLYGFGDSEGNRVVFDGNGYKFTASTGVDFAAFIVSGGNGYTAGNSDDDATKWTEAAYPYGRITIKNLTVQNNGGLIAAYRKFRLTIENVNTVSLGNAGFVNWRNLAGGDGVNYGNEITFKDCTINGNLNTGNSIPNNKIVFDNTVWTANVSLASTWTFEVKNGSAITGAVNVGSGKFELKEKSSVTGNVTVDGGTVDLQQTSVVNGRVVVKNTSKVDIAGKVTSTADAVIDLQSMSATAQVEIKDGADISLTGSTAGWLAVIKMHNGTLKVTGGTIENKNTGTSSGMVVNVYSGTLDIDGGILKNSNSGKGTQVVNLNSATSKLDMSGGIVSGKSTAIISRNGHNADTSEIKISGGLVFGTTALNADTSSEPKVDITGGVLCGAVKVNAGNANSDHGYLKISGTAIINGAITSAVPTEIDGADLRGNISVTAGKLDLISGSLLSGCTVTCSDGVTKTEETAFAKDKYVAMIGTTGYATLAKAAAAAKDGETVELLCDVYESEVKVYGGTTTGVTIDGNGFTMYDWGVYGDKYFFRVYAGTDSLYTLADNTWKNDAAGNAAKLADLPYGIITVKDLTLNGSKFSDGVGGFVTYRKQDLTLNNVNIESSARGTIQSGRVNPVAKMTFIGGTYSNCSAFGFAKDRYASLIIKDGTFNTDLTVAVSGATIENQTLNRLVKISGGTEANPVEIKGNCVINEGLTVNDGAYATINNATVTKSTDKPLIVEGAATLIANKVSFTAKNKNDDAVLVRNANTYFKADDCDFIANIEGGNDSSAFQIQDKATAEISNSYFESADSHITVRVRENTVLTLIDSEVVQTGTGPAVSDLGSSSTIKLEGGTYTAPATAISISATETNLTANNAKVTAGKTAVYSANGSTAVLNKGEYVSETGGNPTVTVDKNGRVELNDAKVTNNGTGSAVADYNPGETGHGYTNSIVINGGTYTANGTVLRAWEKDAETGAQTATLVIKNANIYSFENDANGSYAFGGATTVNGYMAAMLNPAGQFGGRDYETTTTVDGKTLYVFTDEANGGPMVAQSGASMRIAKGSDGLRFTSFLSQKTVDAINAIAAKDEDGNPIVTFGTAIVPTHIIAEAGLDTFDVEGIRAAGYKVLMIDADRTMANTLRDEEGEVYGYNIRAAITGIGVHGEERYNWKYSAITYITYTNARSGEVETVYGAYNEAENSRCITEIAVKAYADVKDVDDEGYDPSVYIYACEGGYSPYTTAQRATIKSFADKYDAALIK